MFTANVIENVFDSHSQYFFTRLYQVGKHKPLKLFRREYVVRRRWFPHLRNDPICAKNLSPVTHHVHDVICSISKDRVSQFRFLYHPAAKSFYGANVPCNREIPTAYDRNRSIELILQTREFHGGWKTTCLSDIGFHEIGNVGFGLHRKSYVGRRLLVIAQRHFYGTAKFPGPVRSVTVRGPQSNPYCSRVFNWA